MGSYRFGGRRRLGKTRGIARRVGIAGVMGMAVFLAGSMSASGRPEHIRPGVEYYSDDFVERDGVRDIRLEKNYEEVYQHFRYYGVVYDERERVHVFREYVRGVVVRTDRYRYDEAGNRVAHEVDRPGEPPPPEARGDP